MPFSLKCRTSSRIQARRVVDLHDQLFARLQGLRRGVVQPHEEAPH
jgi:hypothetical protein